MNIKEIIKNCKYSSDLPFDVDFDTIPDYSNEKVVEIDGINIPKLGELTVREVWFFDLLSTEKTNKYADIQTQYVKLANNIKNRFLINNFQEAQDLLSGYIDESSPNKKALQEIAESSEYEEFLLSKKTELVDLSKSLQEIKNDKQENLIKATVFLRSRCDVKWDIENTINLKQSTLKKVIDFINEEIGVDVNSTVEDEISKETDPKK